MTHSTATRRLVKSPPELWAELSSEESLGRHLAQFGEIRITRVEPETTVAWEGDRASGTVELAPTGWGTKVILTATASVPPARPPTVADAVQAAAPVRPPPAPRRGFLARLFRRRPPAGDRSPAVEAKKRGDIRPMSSSRPHEGSSRAGAPPSAGIPGPPLPGPDPSPPAPMPDPSPLPPAPDPVPPDPAPTLPEPQIEVLDPGRTAAILDEVLDDLGAAHHRPFSRD